MHFSAFFRFWLPPLLWAALIFVLSSIPDLAPPEAIQFRFWDKLAHASVYAILGALIARAWTGTNRHYALIASMMIGTLYGASDELHQFFVPGRFSQISDIVADAAGSSIGAWTWLRIVGLRSKSA